MQHIQLFVSACDVLDSTAEHFMAAHDYYQSHAALGHAAMCKKEAMELWKLEKKVKEYIFQRGGSFSQKNGTQPIQMGWGFNDVIPMLKDKQIVASNTIESTVNSLCQAGSNVDAQFLGKIFRCHLKEVREITVLSDHAASDQKTVDFDRYLYQEYHHKDGCSCGK
jgi:hypothetical protein